MRLEAGELSEILSALNRQANALGTDPRRAPRMRIHATTQITVCPPALLNFSVDPASGERRLLDSSRGQTGPINVRIQDISARGVCLQHTTAMQAGDQFVLHLPHRHAPPVNILCTVARARPGPREHWFIGAEFTCVVGCPPPHPAGDRVTGIQQSILA